MKNVCSFLKQILGNDRGFSIIQGLALAATLGGVSLALMQQNKISNQQSRAASTSMAVLDMQGQLQNYLLIKNACSNSLRPNGALQTNGANKQVLSIKNESDADVFLRGSTYLQNQVQIEEMIFTRSTDTTGVLAVTFNRVGNKDGRGLGSAKVRKEFPINAKWDATNGQLVECYSDLNDAVEIAVSGVLAGLCSEDPTATPNGLFFDATTQFCQLRELAAPPLVTACPADQAIVQISYDLNTRQYTSVCQAGYDFDKLNCSNDSLIRRRSDGKFDCVKPTCGNGIFQGLDGNGAAICLGCGNGQAAVFANGAWRCSNLSCTEPNKYFTGIDSQGSAICANLVEGSNCGAGGKLEVVGNGSVKFSCCTPACTPQSAQCSGTVYPSTNGCGACYGTKPVDCSQASNYCAGSSYTPGDGCGSCAGTKPAQPGVWSNWAPTEEYRITSGATCDCSANKIAQERKFTRSCTQPTCGGAACSGDNETWMDGGSQACAPNSCAAIQIAWELYDEYPYTADNNIKFYNRTKGTEELQAWGPYTSGLYVSGYAGDKIYIEHNLPNDSYVWASGSTAVMEVYEDSTLLYNKTKTSKQSDGIEITLNPGKTYRVFSRSYEKASGGGGDECLNELNTRGRDWYCCPKGQPIGVIEQTVQCHYGTSTPNYDLWYCEPGGARGSENVQMKCMAWD